MSSPLDGFRGVLVRPGDPAYDAARSVYNGTIDRRPALVARCASPSDVAMAVRYARTEGLAIAVRGGGHSAAGYSTCDGGVVIDLGGMRSIEVDPASRRVRAGGGVLWKALDEATAVHGLATPGGLISSTGIAGFTLGGGIGWLSRRLGLACDNLLEAEVVTASGNLVRASEDENPELLWGLRGGCGNFGIATSFTYALHPLSEVIVSLRMWPIDRAAEVLKFYREFMDDAPDELSTWCLAMTAPPEPFVPDEVKGKRVVTLLSCVQGTMEHAERLLAPLADLGMPVVRVLRPAPYTFLQTMLDKGAPHGLRNYFRANYLPGLPDGVAEVFAERGAATLTPRSQLQIIRLGGAIARVPEDATAFPNRTSRYLYHLVSVWTDPAEDEGQIAWNRDVADRLAPYAGNGVYLNFIGDEGQDRVRRAFGPKYGRLAALKRVWDPDNTFKLNQNIAPASS